MRLTKKLLLGILILFTGSTVYSQFTLDGEIRPRFEYRHGYKAVADSAQEAAASTSQRTRLNFNYSTEGYNFKVTLQHVYVWGSQPQLIGTTTQLNTDGSYLNLHEAWAEALLSEKWSLKFGRQEVSYDNQRIFGGVGWAQQARAHDLLQLKFKNEKFKTDVGIAYNQDKQALAKTDAARGTYKAFQYIWLNNKFNDNFNASVLFLNNGKEQLDSLQNNGPSTAYYKDNYSQTVGTNLNFKKNKVAINAAVYSQMGLDGNRNARFVDYKGEYNKEIQALNYSVDFAYKLTDKFTTTVGYEYLSGNTQTDTSAAYNRINHAFTPFYGTNHKFNGFMDYFYVGNHGGSVGLQDIYLKLKFKNDKFWVASDFHIFMAAADVWDGYAYGKALSEATTVEQIDAINANKYTEYIMDNMLGTEVDLTFGFDLSKGVVFKGGYSVLVDTETLAYLKGVTYTAGKNAGQGRIDQMNGWGWAMIIVKPQFYKSEKK